MSHKVFLVLLVLTPIVFGQSNEVEDSSSPSSMFATCCGMGRLLSNLSKEPKVNCILPTTGLKSMTDLEKSVCQSSFNFCCEKEEEMNTACESGILDMRDIRGKSPRKLTSIATALQRMQCTISCFQGLRANITEISHDKCVPGPKFAPLAKFAFSKCCRLGHVKESGCDAETLKLDGSCIDINECEAKTDVCLIKVEECINTHGSYECRKIVAEDIETITVYPAEDILDILEEDLRDRLIEKVFEKLTNSTTEGRHVHAGATHW